MLDRKYLAGAFAGFVIVIGIIGYAMSGESSEEKDCRNAIAMLQAATSEGVNFSRFSDLIVDARGKCEIARASMQAAQMSAVDHSLDAMSAVKDIWAESIRWPRVCPSVCEDDLLAPTETLGIFKDQTEYRKWASDPASSWEEDATREAFIGRALSIASIMTTICMKYPAQCKNGS